MLVCCMAVGAYCDQSQREFVKAMNHYRQAEVDCSDSDAVYDYMGLIILEESWYAWPKHVKSFHLTFAL